MWRSFFKHFALHALAHFTIPTSVWFSRGRTQATSASQEKQNRYIQGYERALNPTKYFSNDASGDRFLFLEAFFAWRNKTLTLFEMTHKNTHWQRGTVCVCVYHTSCAVLYIQTQSAVTVASLQHANSLTAIQNQLYWELMSSYNRMICKPLLTHWIQYKDQIFNVGRFVSY